MIQANSNTGENCRYVCITDCRIEVTILNVLGSEYWVMSYIIFRCRAYLAAHSEVKRLGEAKAIACKTKAA